ncbi:MAG: ABC transporter ATP-binding protein [Armatimonadota bacterium]|nr:ABC transporter ATP-binding protein [Armatimonadota bacterium]MDR7439613.1 ABC transporter ATP-binding protein [Armatimonadota bacterium]MDR7562828.1 ABC transporter ATP-binding protein [Armatimonadota bacterium]MDR7568312.1 ABC transporter ATP-binding protein [Armatimonadota bacterium]MDR7602074.1 ABC transporter ATP-binding protein [Armatimonadota bacterium]
MTPAIACRGLVRTFGLLRAVDGVDLAVQRGEIFALVGPDGAGKTTLIRLLCGALEPTSGEIRVTGLDVMREGEAVRGRIGYMPQQFSLYGDLTVLENLRLYGDLYGVPPDRFRERAERLLAAFGLEGARHRLALALSGGMRQKLALACTLVHEPEVLLLDEPTTGVDPLSRRQFWRVLYELNRQGITVFLSTTYLDEADRASRVGLLHRGRLLACDDPAQLRAQLGGAVVEVMAVPRSEAKAVLREHPLVRSLEVFGDRFHVLLASEADLGSLRRSLLEAGVTVRGLRAVRPGLEDVFVARLQP